MLQILLAELLISSALYGTWELLDGCKIIPQDVGMICSYISRDLATCNTGIEDVEEGAPHGETGEEEALDFMDGDPDKAR